MNSSALSGRERTAGAVDAATVKVSTTQNNNPKGPKPLGCKSSYPNNVPEGPEVNSIEALRGGEFPGSTVYNGGEGEPVGNRSGS
jgi:hypothetical protein